MSKFDSPDPGNDPAYTDGTTDPGHRAFQRRACAQCGGDVWIGRREPYQLTVWCARCLAEAKRADANRRA